MIRDGKKLPNNILEKVSDIVEKISEDVDVVALYAYGSLAKGDLKPLSDLDFAILLNEEFTSKQCFEKHLNLLDIFNQTFHTDEIDLIILNKAPLRFSHAVITKGKLLFSRDRGKIVDFFEHKQKLYLDFMHFRKQFDTVFLERIGYYG